MTVEWRKKGRADDDAKPESDELVERLAKAEEELAQKEAEFVAKEEECGVAQGEIKNLMRYLADERNRMKRLERETEKVLKRAAAPLVRDLLRVVDNVERALVPPVGGADDGESLRRGLDLILRDFEDALARAGAVPFESRGEPFDPESHEAMGEVERAEVAPGTVVEELARGWRLNGLLLRVARVMVTPTPEPPAPPEPIKPLEPSEPSDSADDTALPNDPAPSLEPSGTAPSAPPTKDPTPNSEPSATASSETTSSPEPPKPPKPPEAPDSAGDTASSNDTAPSPAPSATAPNPEPNAAPNEAEPSPAPSGTAVPNAPAPSDT